jgi:hypothetical protein
VRAGISFLEIFFGAAGAGPAPLRNAVLNLHCDREQELLGD